jgi:two-component system sensor histidine kinase KdpD
VKAFATLPFRPVERPAWYDPLGYLAAVAGVAAATGVLWLAQPIISLGSVYLLYLVVVVAVAVGWGLGQGVVTSVLAFLCANYFFTPPRFTFTIADFQDLLALTIFLGLATLTSQLVSRLRREAREARRGQQVTATLYTLSQTINREHNLQTLLRELSAQLCDVLSLAGCAITLQDREGVGKVSAWSGEPFGAASGEGELVRMPLSAGGVVIGSLVLRLPQGRHALNREETRIVEAFRDQLQLAIERARLQQATIQTEVLRRTDALRAALLSAVAHDLRTPLGSIKAAATSLLNPKMRWPDEDRQAFLEAIVSEVDRINRLATNLLDVSRIEAGRLTPHKEMHRIEGVIETVLERLTPLLGEHPISITIEPDLPAVSMDAVEIDEVLTNLLENAAKYTPPATPITVRARLTNGFIEVGVEDNGPGIPPQHLPYLFDRFYRVTAGEQGGVGGAKGMGLGLAIVKGVVEAHGGQVRAENKQEGGTVFSFTLPLQAAEPETRDKRIEDSEE